MAAEARKRIARVHSCKRCQLNETPRVNWAAGMDPVAVNYLKSGHLDIPSNCSISSTHCELMFTDGAGIMTTMIPTDDGRDIPVTSGEFVKISAKLRFGHPCHISQLTIQLPWSLAITSQIGRYTPYHSSKGGHERLILRQT